MNKKVYLITLFIVSALALFCSNRTEVKSLQITEFLALNKSNLVDSLGKSHDWIEIYNNGKKELDLSEFYVSDNANKPQKHKLSGTIAPNSYKLLLASGMEDMANHLPFKLDKSGGELILSSRKGNILQKITYNQQIEDVSTAFIDGQWNYNITPTPSKENSQAGLKTNLSEGVAIYFIEQDGQIRAGINSESEDDIYYTINGDSPFSESALLYKEPFVLDTFLMVRAALKGELILLHEEKMSSYVDRSLHTVPVLSLSTDPANLWDEKIGLFAGTNYGFRSKEWIRLGQIDYVSDSVSAHEYIDFKVFGNASRSKTKKSLTIRGRENIPNHFFTSLTSKKIDGFIARACHASTIKYKNEIVHDVNESMRSEMLMQQYIPAALYINGNYWGIYNIMERKNDKFVENHTGGVPDDMLNANNAQAKLEKGDISSYNTLLEKLNSTEDEEKLMQLLEENFNISSLLDFWCQEIIVRRIDTYNNRLWKDVEKENVWNFISFDYDICFTKPYDDKLIERYLRSKEAKGIAHISPFMKCSKFREMFAYRLLEYLNFGYSEQNITEVLKKYEDLTATEFQLDTARWVNPKKSRFMPKVSNTVSNFSRYVIKRKKHLLENYFPTIGYEGQVIFSIPDSLNGSVFINGYEAVGEIVFFTGMSVDIEVKNKDDWNFIGWKDDLGNEIEVNDHFSSDQPIVIHPVVSAK
ncbi:MAG: CotH kinase family protein [Flavobacteriales bacterium]|jgi:hypothetical protein|tara:strand:+ start:112 stop:2205 length:2094 start_codon:yes stop_codon:yes gene_type:complete